MKTKRIRGINLIYKDEGSGHPLVFVHGHPFNHSMWDNQIEQFSSTYRTIAPDLRGYGQSGIKPGVVLLDELALDILVLLDELNIEKAIFCGLSMGGQIVLDFYRLFPQRVSALILCDTSATAETIDGYRNRLATSERFEQLGMKTFCDTQLHHFFSAKTLDEKPDVVETVKEMILTTPVAGAAATNRGRAERRDHTPILGKIVVPTLIVVGGQDFFTPVSDARYMADRISNSEMVVIQEAGHIPNLECPDEFNKDLSKFLDSGKIVKG